MNNRAIENNDNNAEILFQGKYFEDENLATKLMTIWLRQKKVLEYQHNF